MERQQQTTSAGQDAARKPGEGSATQQGAAAQQAWLGYVRDIEADGASEEGGSGNGVRRMFTVAVPLPGSKTGEMMYLGKWYYDNVTQSQVQSYERHAITPNGWFPITKTQFEMQHGATNKKGEVTRKADPDAWTYEVRGPGGSSVKREKMAFGNVIGTPDGAFFPVDRTECDVEIELGEAPSTDCSGLIQARAEDGTVRVLGKLFFAAGQKVAKSHYKIEKGESLRFTVDLPEAEVNVYAVVEIKKSGGAKTFSNMAQYGTESPTSGDIDAVVKARQGR